MAPDTRRNDLRAEMQLAPETYRGSDQSLAPKGRGVEDLLDSWSRRTCFRPSSIEIRFHLRSQDRRPKPLRTAEGQDQHLRFPRASCHHRQGGGTCRQCSFRRGRGDDPVREGASACSRTSSRPSCSNRTVFQVSASCPSNARPCRHRLPSTPRPEVRTDKPQNCFPFSGLEAPRDAGHMRSIHQENNHARIDFRLDRGAC